MSTEDWLSIEEIFREIYDSENEALVVKAAS